MRVAHLPVARGAARPAELIFIDADEAAAADGDAVAPGSPPGAFIASAAADEAENVDPNSPPANGKRARGRAGGGACGTPRPCDTAEALPPSYLPTTPPSSSAASRTSAAADASHAEPKQKAKPGTPRPAASMTRTADGPGTPRPEGGRGGTPRWGKGVGAAAADANDDDDDGEGAMSPVVSVVVEDSSVRRAEDFSHDTPQPKLTRRAYLHRKAKEEGKGTASADRGASGGAGRSGKHKPTFGDHTPGRTPGEAADSPSGAAGASSPLVASPKLRRQPTPIVGYAAADATGDQSHIAPPTAGSGGGATAVAADEEDEEREDAAVAQLRSSVRALAF